jgi:phenylacetate-coenzyme A ligase PaaK-like adenylate-forming protein
MMSIKASIIQFVAKIRARQLYKQSKRAIEYQEKTFQKLIAEGQKTRFGKDHDFANIKTVADFQNQVPVRDYEACRGYFDNIVAGEENVSWPEKPLYLAKTSGTTSGAKYIPISSASIKRQIASARDALFMYVAETGNADFFDGKMMFLSGSPEIEKNPAGMAVGRLSGIVNHFVPSWLTANRVPGYETNCIEDWELKVKTIVSEIKDQDLRLISGIPPWVQMLFEELERQTGKKPLEVWPKLSLFVQGGVDFSPYEPVFEEYFENKVDMVEVFPASEGFFAFQYSQKHNGLLILPDNGIFFEFIPIEDYHSPNPRRLTLEQVELDRQYALILSTNAGLWAYDIGDTVKFTSLEPYTLRVTGRVKHFISAFGEHVIVEEVNHAMNEASAAFGAKVKEFTVAPYVVAEQGESRHQWFVEFLEKPQDLEAFTKTLDHILQKQNSYYFDLREGNILKQAQLIAVPLDASREYMKAQGKLGGQNKFPRLTNDRKIADWMLNFKP